jgi:hypothetical protein
MSQKAINDLTARAKVHEDRAEKLRSIIAILQTDHTLAAELLDILASPESGLARTPTKPQPVLRRRTTTPQLEQVIDAFLDVDNEWKTAADLSVATSQTRNTINALLYTSKYKVLFDTKKFGPKKRMWRLKPRVAEIGSLDEIVSNLDALLREESGAGGVENPLGELD